MKYQEEKKLLIKKRQSRPPTYRRPYPIPPPYPRPPINPTQKSNYISITKIRQDIINIQEVINATRSYQGMSPHIWKKY